MEVIFIKAVIQNQLVKNFIEDLITTIIIFNYLTPMNVTIKKTIIIIVTWLFIILNHLSHYP